MIRAALVAPVSALVLVLVLAFAAGSASAQAVSEEDAQKVADVVVGELKREEIIPHKTFFASILAGYHGDVAGFGELRVGYGKGRYKRNIVLPTVTMWRVSAAVRGSYGKSDAVAASLLGGWGKVSLLGVTLEAGVDAHLTPGDVNVGPIASLGLRVGPVGLHTSVWTHLTGDETEGGFTIGLGYHLKDWKSPKDAAKERAEEELKARGLPVP